MKRLEVTGRQILTERRLEKKSPLGIIKKEIIVNGSRNIQWNINVGGTADDNYHSGIQFPVYILVFGIGGGYIRYLYDIYQVKKNRTLLHRVRYLL